jgi:hypothetical protein
MAKLEYTAREHFVPFHMRRQRWATLATHRRAGKTVALVNDVIEKSLACPLRRPQHAYVGPTFTQSKRIAWQYLKDYSEPYFAKPPSESELKVNLIGDRTIYCLGADNPDSLRGMYLDGGVGDEYALFRPSTFSTIIRPALSDRNGWWVFASTPRGKNLFYAEHKKALASPSEYFSLILKASESGIIPKEELEALRKDMDPEEFAQEYEVSFDAALKGAIYADEINQLFVDKRVRADLYDPNLVTHVVFDLGFTDSTVAIWWQEHKDGTLRVVNTEATQGKDIFHHIDRILKFKGSNELGEVWLPHDARAKNLQTGRSIVEQFLQEGIRPSIVPSHKVRDRIAATRQLFPRIWLAEESSDDLLEALKGYRREWDENKLMFSDTPLHDWCSDYADSFGYMCVVAAPKFVGVRSADASAEAEAKRNSKRGPAFSLQVDLHHLFEDNEARGRSVIRRIG